MAHARCPNGHPLRELTPEIYACIDADGRVGNLWEDDAVGFRASLLNSNLSLQLAERLIEAMDKANQCRAT